MKYLLFTMVIFLTGCGHFFPKQTTLIYESELLKVENKDSLFKALELSKENWLLEEMELHKIGKFSILLSKDGKTIYVVYKNKIMASHEISGISRLFNSKFAPLPESFSIEYNKNINSLSYRNSNYEFFDLNMDGIDVIYNFKQDNNIYDYIYLNINPVATFYNNKQCIQYQKIPASTVSCCPTSPKNLDGLIFGRTYGWKKLNNKGILKQEELDNFCKSLLR